MTINLEKELIRQNRRVAMPAELLAIREFEQNAGLIENDALERVGLTTQIRKGKEIKDRLSSKRKETDNFKQERVFHISQISALCHKYDLRFLPSVLFKGQIDSVLATKIVNFEAAYKVTCRGGNEEYASSSDIMQDYYRKFNDGEFPNTFIVAPAESFALQERPKDPLFFYEINDEYYYLVHKWGNDLNIFRRIAAWWKFDFGHVFSWDDFERNWRSPIQ